ncbi:l-serine dehydratase iron-sulfur-dependent beta subunit [Clostridium sp. CAG:411]|jgi:L-serine deaminase|nr:L-serine ammonia-lyase, iron-sulfur-dependent, subunit alpha [Lachnospiraceae bacterium]CDE46792.1 l-serine dehydratase iron-sulfur-dependent beta subunit [Clostridium sp. CAG:411]
MALLDIIGPIMVGPSSSHTAGAVRIGQMTRKLLNDRPVKGEILLHGSFATTGKGHGTDKALVAGILGFSTDQSMTAMEKTFTVMCETIDTYRSGRMSASGLVGDESGKLEKYRTQSVDKVEENGKQSPLCGNFMGEAMVIALKMAESNTCMRRIVAAPTAGSCGVLPAMLIPYYRMNMGEKEEIVKVLYEAGNFLASGGVHDSSDFFSITISG